MNEIDTVYKRLFATDDGKRVLNDLRSFCHDNSTTVSVQGQQPFDVFLREGRRQVYLRISQKGNL